MSNYHAVIPAAGNGSRFGGESPKQYWMLREKPVLLHSIERLAATIRLSQTYVAIAAHDLWFDRTIGTHAGVTVLRCGGATRSETVRNTLAALAGVAEDDWIVVHDAVRPCLDSASVTRLQEELGHDPVGGLLAVPVVGPLMRANQDGRGAKTESSESLWRAQTPQMFRYHVLRDALASSTAADCSDEAQAVERLGLRPRLVMGHPNNIKITYPDDLKLAAAIMSGPQHAMSA